MAWALEKLFTLNLLEIGILLNSKEKLQKSSIIYICLDGPWLAGALKIYTFPAALFQLTFSKVG